MFPTVTPADLLAKFRLPHLAVLVPGVAWMVPLFTQLHKRYVCLGPISLYGLLLGALMAGVCAAIYFFSTARDATGPKPKGWSPYASIVLGGLVSGVLWAPLYNAWFDFRPTFVVDGEIVEIDKPGKGNPSRIVKATIGGQEREGSFYPHAHFWHVAKVREGGSVRLTVGPGLFVPWVAKFEDP